MNFEIKGIRWIDGSYLRLVLAYVMACKVMLWRAIRADFLYLFRKSSLVNQSTKLFPSFLLYPGTQSIVLHRLWRLTESLRASRELYYCHHYYHHLFLCVCTFLSRHVTETPIRLALSDVL